jgi:catechol 2,3-dioxygenase-like lactoylglutathione lyase family enzyme
MDFRIELVPIAVTDVDRSVEFYGAGLGWNVDHDRTVSPELRFVQVTPPGSACSFCFGKGLGMLPEGQRQYLQVVVADADAARAHLVERDIECTDVEELAWGRFVNFSDPDGNRWVLQELPQRG